MNSPKFPFIMNIYTIINIIFQTSINNKILFSNSQSQKKLLELIQEIKYLLKIQILVGSK